MLITKIRKALKKIPLLECNCVQSCIVVLLFLPQLPKGKAETGSLWQSTNPSRRTPWLVTFSETLFWNSDYSQKWKFCPFYHPEETFFKTKLQNGSASMHQNWCLAPDPLLTIEYKPTMCLQSWKSNDNNVMPQSFCPQNQNPASLLESSPIEVSWTDKYQYQYQLVEALVGKCLNETAARFFTYKWQNVTTPTQCTSDKTSKWPDTSTWEASILIASEAQRTHNKILTLCYILRQYCWTPKLAKWNTVHRRFLTLLATKFIMKSTLIIDKFSS